MPILLKAKPKATVAPPAPKPKAPTPTPQVAAKVPQKAVLLKTKAPLAKAAEPVTEVEPFDMSLEELADEFASMQDKCQAIMLRPEFTKLNLLETELKERLKAYDKTDSVTIKGEHWLVVANACSKSPRKVVNTEAVYKFLGKETFLKLAKIGLTEAEKYLTPDQFVQVASEETLSDNRKITTKFLG